MVYDGGGKTIDGSGKDIVFALWQCKNVVVRNWVITGVAHTRAFDVSGATNCVVENIVIKGTFGDGANIRTSNTITFRSMTADKLDRYFVWCDNSNGVRIDNCKLLTGSRLETGIRLQYNVKNIVITNSNIRNVINKNTALRLHDGDGFRVANSTFEGQVQVGPMGGDQGGQLITNSVLRRTELARRTTNVIFDTVTIKGAICPLAGLSKFNMSGGSITAKTGPLFYGWVVTNATWSYPDRAKLRPGDVSRPTPVGFMTGVKFIAPGKSTLNAATNGPLTPKACTLNGKRIG
jgi:hypothetical protein